MLIYVCKVSLVSGVLGALYKLVDNNNNNNNNNNVIRLHLLKSQLEMLIRQSSF